MYSYTYPGCFHYTIVANILQVFSNPQTYLLIQNAPIQPSITLINSISSPHGAPLRTINPPRLIWVRPHAKAVQEFMAASIKKATLDHPVVIGLGDLEVPV